MNMGQEGVENPLESLEQNVETFQEKQERLEERQEQIDRTLSGLEQDAAVQQALEHNRENLAEAQAELENERIDAVSSLEQIKEQLEQIDAETNKSDAALDMLRVLGEDVSECDGIIADRRAWLEECYRRVEDLAAMLGENYENIGKFQPSSEKSPETVQEVPEQPEEHAAQLPRNNEDAVPDEPPASVQTQDPVTAYGQYMLGHNWGQKDYFTYTRDPEWQRLYHAAYPGRPVPKLDTKTANQMMSDYMNRHNYGQPDFAEYSQDPEWRALARAAWPDYQLPKLQRDAASQNLYKYMCEHNYDLADAPVYCQDPFWQELNFAANPEDIRTVKIWTEAINPNYKNPDLSLSQQRLYEENCGACAFALEQHFNGQDLQIIATDKNIPTDQEMEQKTGKKCVYMAPDKIEQILYREGAGSHLIVGINRRNPITGKPATGHWFNVYYDGKKVHTVDGQSGKIYEWPHDYGNVSEWCAMI